MTTPTSLLRRLPKAELHLHVEGTLEPELAFTLARRNGVTLPAADAAGLRRQYDFSDLQSFLDLYYACTSVLQTPQDFTDLADAYLARAAADGVTHVEIFFDPQAHTGRGVPIEAVMDGLLTAAGHDQHGVSVGLIACIMRDLGPEAADTMLDRIEPWFDRITAIGMDSAEVGFPPAPFARVYDRAAEAGLRKVAHAGEEGPPEYMWEAIEVLGVERIDHGIRCLEDPRLVAHLVETQLPLTVCPLSNVKLRCVPDIASHPLRTMLDAGLNVSIHSDDPSYFGGYVGDNVEAVATGLNLSVDQVVTLAANSFRSSFLPPEQVAGHLADLESRVL